MLVTGGAGFIGSHIVEALLAGGHAVAVLDDLSSGSAAHVPPGVTLHRLDVASDDLTPAFRGEPYDAIVHLAAQVKVQLSMADPARDLAVNVIGTRRLLEVAAAGARPARFVFMSTGGAIYGETERAADERTLPDPRSYYAAHKLCAEHYVRLSGLSHAILRPSNVYGPRQRSDLEGGVVAIFTERLRAGQPIELYGDGEQTRDFVYVKDLVRATRAALAFRRSGTWNIGSGEAITIRALLERLAAAIAPPVAVIPRPPRAGDLRHSCLDAGLAARDGLWTPTYTLDAGIADMLSDASPRAS